MKNYEECGGDVVGLTDYTPGSICTKPKGHEGLCITMDGIRRRIAAVEMVGAILASARCSELKYGDVLWVVHQAHGMLEHGELTRRQEGDPV